MGLTDVAFVHWPVPAAPLDGAVPDWLSVEEFDGTAWVSALSYTLARFDAFGVPVRRDVDAFDLRTYVRGPGDDRGVYFLAVDVTDRLVVATARSTFRLPAHHVAVERATRDGREEVSVTRVDGSGRTFEASYRASGETTRAGADTLASALTERYRYFGTGPMGTRLVGSVGHEPWELTPVDATVGDRSLVPRRIREALEADPLCHYSPGTEMRIGVPRPVE